MNTSAGSIRTRLHDAAEGRIVVGIVVVLASVLVLPVPVWLIMLVAAMASRPPGRPRGVLEPDVPYPDLRRWLLVSSVFVGGVLVTMVGKPLTSHGMQLVIWFALLPAIGVLFWFQRRRRHTVGALWLGATVAAAMAGIVAIVQVGVIGDLRATGITANSITFGNLALVFGVVSLSLHRLIDLPRHLTVAVSLAAGSLGLTASILSGARGGWLAVPMLCALLLWQARHELDSRRLARLAIGMLAVFVITNTLSSGMPTSRASASVSNVSDYQTGYQTRSPRSETAASSEGARIEAWRSASDVFADHPLTGIGWGNLASQFDRDVALGLRNERISTFDHAHNQLLGAASNGGVIGLSTMIALFAVPLVGFGRAVRRGDPRSQAVGLTGVAVIGAYACFGLTESVLENLGPITVLATLVAALCSELDRSGSERWGAGHGTPSAAPVPLRHRRARPTSPHMQRWIQPFPPLH